MVPVPVTVLRGRNGKGNSRGGSQEGFPEEGAIWCPKACQGEGQTDKEDRMVEGGVSRKAEQQVQRPEGGREHGHVLANSSKFSTARASDTRLCG